MKNFLKYSLGFLFTFFLFVLIFVQFIEMTIQTKIKTIFFQANQQTNIQKKINIDLVSDAQAKSLTDKSEFSKDDFSWSITLNDEKINIVENNDVDHAIEYQAIEEQKPQSKNPFTEHHKTTLGGVEKTFSSDSAIKIYKQKVSAEIERKINEIPIEEINRLDRLDAINNFELDEIDLSLTRTTSVGTVGTYETSHWINYKDTNGDYLKIELKTKTETNDMDSGFLWVVNVRYNDYSAWGDNPDVGNPISRISYDLTNTGDLTIVQDIIKNYVKTRMKSSSYSWWTSKPNFNPFSK